MRLLDQTYSDLKGLLMADFRDLKPKDVADILNDFEKGVAHIRFELNVKISLWQQLPLILAAMGEDDCTLARTYLKMAVDQYEQTQDSARHCPITHHYLGPESSIRPHILSFITGAEPTPIFIKHRRRMKMIRTNEISAESLHRQGSILEKQVCYHNAATLSFDLRHTEAATSFPLVQWAAAVEEVNTDLKVAERFSLSEHKVLADFRDQQLLDGNSVQSGRKGMFKLIRQAFYRCDPYSLFQTFPLVEDVIEEQRKAWKKDDLEREHDPIKMSAKGTFEEKQHAVLCRYGLKHLKEVASEDHVYAFPRGFASKLMPLTKALAPKHDLMDLAAGVQDDGIDLEACYSKDARTSPLLCLRIVNIQPKRRKVHVTATNEMRSDMIAVSVYEVTNRSRKERSLCIQSKMEEEMSQVRLLAAEAFLAVGMDNLKRSMVESALTSEATYHFEGVPLPRQCHDHEGWSVLTHIVNAGAYPGPFALWSPSPTLGEDARRCLQDFIAAGLVSELQPGMFQVTVMGMKYLQRSRVCKSHRHVFHRREVPVLEWTQWELLDWLLRRDWQLHPYVPRKAPPALMLSASEDIKSKT